ncbi:MAG: 2-oxoacid:acceptor oxidoreductase family protein [Promethearchaeota archaeon]
MIEIRFHGRGGQGAWTATQILAKAVIHEGRYTQSFPAFGPERSGAPVEAYVRISDSPIDLHCGIYEPDSVVVLDPTLLDAVDVSDGLVQNGIIAINSRDSPSDLKKRINLTKSQRVWVIPATDLSVEILGREITSTAMIGALVKATGYTKLESVLEATEERFRGKVGEMNVQLITRAYEEAKESD